MLKAIKDAVMRNRKKPQEVVQEQQAAVKRIGEMPIEIKPRAIPVRYELPILTAERVQYLLKSQNERIAAITENFNTQVKTLQAQSNSLIEKVRTEGRFRVEERLYDFKTDNNIFPTIPYTVDGDCIIFMFPPDLAPKPEPSTDEEI